MKLKNIVILIAVAIVFWRLLGVAQAVDMHLVTETPANVPSVENQPRINLTITVSAIPIGKRLLADNPKIP
jgi:Flp pilus assembly protein CpaB